MPLTAAFFQDVVPKDAASQSPVDCSTLPIWDLSRCKPSSKFNPPNVCTAVKTYIKLCELEVSKIKWGSRVKSNLTYRERLTLRSLHDDVGITIRAADTGGAIVVMDMEQYTREAHLQLNDSQHYTKLCGDPLNVIQQHIEALLHGAQLAQIINVKEAAYLTKTNPKTPFLYLLPKIHKNLMNPPGRPIVSGCDSVLQPLSVFVDLHLQPLVLKMRYIKDTTAFLTRIADYRPLDSDTWLCTMDVSSLYTSIPHDGGLEAIGLSIAAYQIDAEYKNFILELLKTVLTKNYFTFDGDYYLQTQGTAMGSNVAPSYANLFMDRFEQSFVYPYDEFECTMASLY
ncbi:LOW QUALITY PROTEIN: uncharacterized protein RCH25_039876 [Pelodytes ibericus]